jgi:hypothetical protein
MLQNVMEAQMFGRMKSLAADKTQATGRPVADSLLVIR